jgi:hypothetical protein
VTTAPGLQLLNICAGGDPIAGSPFNVSAKVLPSVFSMASLLGFLFYLLIFILFNFILI